MPKIALIGGGASATLFLAHFSANPDAHRFSIDVYDRDNAFARGIAYSTKEMCHLLNVPAFNMSAYQHDSNHFAAWAENHGYTETDFLPRKLYGFYLQSVWEKAEENLTLHRIQKDVTHITKNDNGFSVYCGDDVSRYDDVILATGNSKPLRLSRVQESSRYYDSPWVIDKSVQTYHHVVLIGSGLSAIDALLSLKENGFKGRITLVSKHGALPEPHGEIVKGKTPWFFDENDLTLKSPLALFSFIRNQIKEAERSGSAWRSVIDGLRPFTNSIWQGWSDNEKRHFMRHLYTLWGVHRHRMAGEIFDTVEKIKQNQNIQQQKNRAVEILSGEKGCQVVLDNQETISCDAVINCMGYRYDENRSFESSYKIGPANFGALFETTAIPEIRKQASDVAEQLIKKAGEISPAFAAHS